MLNHIVMMGRLTQDPELRTAGETPVCHFRLACDRDYKAKNSGAKYFAKGRMAVVTGRLQIRTWTDADGNKRGSSEIVAEHVYFGDSKPKSVEASEPGDDFIPDFREGNGDLPF